MRDDSPTVYLLAGGPHAGRITYAKALEAAGAVRLGLADDDAASRDEIDALLTAHVAAGRDVVLEHGLDEPEERDIYKRLVEEHGGQWCLINFTADHTQLLERLQSADDPGRVASG